MPEACLFCRIIAKEIPAAIVFESDHILAFRDINPQAPVHVVIVPKEHVATLDSASETVIGGLGAAAIAIARQEGIAARGYRTVINTNADGGQTVFHLHMHLLGGRHLSWPPG